MNIDNLSTFRMYGKSKSSCFDFFHNDLEPAQTKGLGYLLVKSFDARVAFYNLLKKKTPSISIQANAASRMKWVVDCELSKNDCRLDILIRLYDKNKPQYSFLLEAKSTKKRVDCQSVESQLNDYIKVFTDELLEFNKDKVFGVVLTQFSLLSPSINNIYISWEELTQQLQPISLRDVLVKDYIDFIISNMKFKFYSDEVLSIAAGDSIGRVEKLRIYMCQPNRFLKLPLFITFREKNGGRMTRLYRIQENIPSINCNDKQELETLSAKYSDIKIADKIKDWNDVDSDNKVRSEEDYRQLIILVQDERYDIILPRPVKPERNNVDSVGWSYSLSDFFSNENECETNREPIIIKRSQKE